MRFIVIADTPRGRFEHSQHASERDAHTEALRLRAAYSQRGQRADHDAYVLTYAK